MNDSGSGVLDAGDPSAMVPGLAVPASSLDSSSLAAELSELARGLRGVVTLYSAQPVIAAVVTATVEAKAAAASAHAKAMNAAASFLSSSAPEAPAGLVETDASAIRRPPIAVEDGENGVTVSVVIGVSDDQPASEVCREVHDSIAAHLRAHGHPIASIGVKVGSIG